MDKKAPTFGFLASGMEESYLIDPYQISIREGLLSGLRTLGGCLISIPNVPGFSEDKGNPDNPFVFELISKDVFDGFVLLTSNLCVDQTIESLESFCKRFRPIPLLCVGVKVPGIPTISVNNRSGMLELMQHLIHHHHFKKPAFIGGPEFHPEARERERIFREEYRKSGIKLDERLITHWTFSTGDGEMAMREIIEKGVDFDCVICANDTMALEAHAVLNESMEPRIKKCPITGFDDAPASSQNPFSLTTVNQPLYAIGETAAQMIFSISKGIEVEDRILDSKLVLRKSCGCQSSETMENSTLSKEESFQWLKDVKQTRDLRSLGISLLRTSGEDQIRPLLTTGLKDLGSGPLTIAIIPEKNRYDKDKKAFPFFRFDPSGNGPVDSIPRIYRLKDIYPPGFHELEGQSCLLSPLNYKDELLGYIIFKDDTHVLEIYYALSLYVASFIKIHELEIKKQNHTKELEKEVNKRIIDYTKEVNKRQKVEKRAIGELQERLRLEKEILTISDRERRRIGQDLHDDICQRLANLIYKSALIEKLKNQVDYSEILNSITDDIGDIITRIKSLSRGLFPEALLKLGLTGALEELVTICNNQGSFKCRFINLSGEDIALNGDTTLHLFRIAQEALQNAIKHSNASEITATILSNQIEFILRIEDNGQGIRIKTINRGVGMSSMKYRADLIGAGLSVESSDKGTRITCIISLKKDRSHG
jgi:signal transduction histidine kinase/DNA-binding LacI/PurR family transcriptional regulator